MKKCGIKKFFLLSGISLGAMFFIIVIYIGIMWGNQIVTLSSLKQVNGNNKNYPFYTMTYKGDYGFNDYLQVGSKSQNEYYDFISKKTMNGVNEPSYKANPNCSSFTAIAPNGDRLLARNEDFNIIATPLLLKTNPTQGYKSMSIVNLAGLNIGLYNNKLPLPLSMNSINILGAPYMPWDGVNEHGVAICILTAAGSSSSEDKNKITINDFSLMRMVLDKTSSINEAVNMIKNYNMVFYDPSLQSHFMIADATGASVVVEYIRGKMQTIYSNKPYQIVTNFILYYNLDDGPGFDRYKRIEEKLNETEGILTEKEAMKLLSENAIPGMEQWSAVYNLTQKKVYVCVDKDYETMYEFDLG